MAARCDNRHIACESGFGQNALQYVTQHRPRLHDLRQDTRGQIQLGHQTGRPTTVACIEQLTRGCDGVFRGLATRQPIMKEVRRHQQRVGEVQ